MDRLNSPKTLFIAVTVDGLFFPQRKALGFDPRESTPGFKRHVTILNSETRSFKRAAILMDRVLGLKVSANTIERICLDVGGELADAEQEQWQSVLKGEVSVPQLAIGEFDGGRIRTRKQGCGSGVHLANKGWNETKNAIFVSAASETFPSDPQLQLHVKPSATYAFRGASSNRRRLASRDICSPNSPEFFMLESTVHRMRLGLCRAFSRFDWPSLASAKNNRRLKLNP